MTYKKHIKIAPDVDAKLMQLKKQYGVQSHNKVLRRLLGLTHHACASLEEARQKECEICLSRIP